MVHCDSRARAYKNGKTFEECRTLARAASADLQKLIRLHGKVLWREILERVDHDELVYKLTLKYLRQDGLDIGDYRRPEVRPR